MDDLIVIILTLVVAGIGILGQIKKKKQAETASNQPNQPEDFWDLIKNEPDFPGQEEENKYYEEENTEPVISPETSYQIVNTAHRKPAVKKDEYGKKTTRKKVKSKTMEGFSLRKAVIYSEILNRKYT